MTVLAGDLSLGLGVVVAAAAVLAALVAVRFESAAALRAGRVMIGTFAGLMTLASAVLILAFLNDEFSIKYVAGYSERALPAGYKLAAFWAGQAGSLLLWAWMLGVMSLIAVLTPRKDGAGISEQAVVIATLAIACGFFAALMLFATDEAGIPAGNPFYATAVTPADGGGLNPMLQDPAMIAHPPLLFLGYAGYTIPFAMMIGALVVGRRDAGWLAASRRWNVASWLFLSVGILLGAWWAYVELGWGGYWAWDPVENASLLPWLTGTALLHSVMVQQQRGMFKIWNVSLIAATFLLCLFGTYLTRSGVIQSVHGFPKSGIGLFFLGLIIAGLTLSVVLIILRAPLLRGENRLEGLVGREGAFLATNILLVGITLVTLIGTIFPIFGRMFGTERAATPEFYNHYVAPMGLILVGLMAMGPLLVYGSDAAAKLARRAIIPGLGALAVAGWLWFQGIHNHWALLGGAIIGMAVLAATVDLVRSVVARMQSYGENPLTALVKLLDAGHRRYGGQTVHMGMAMIVAGVIGSSLFGDKELMQLTPGQNVPFHGSTLTFNKLSEVRRENFTAVEAEVTLAAADGSVKTLNPQRRFYDKSEQPNSEVALRSTLREDMYLTLAGWEKDGSVASFEILRNPLVSWIWIGGIVMTVGGIICLLPRLMPQAQPAAPATVTPPAATKPQNGKARGNRPASDRRPAGVSV
jgi:cytochrome c-type biogenesis protein CcmF